MRIEGLHSSLAYFPDLDRCWRPENLRWTEENIRSLLSEQTDPQSSRSVELLLQLARVHALRGDHGEARARLEEAHVIMAKTQSEALIELRYQLEQGRLLALAMSPQKATQVLLEAWTLAVESKQDFFAVDAAVMLATILPPKAQKKEWLNRAMQIVQQSTRPETKLWLVQLHLMSGWQAYDLRQFEAAMQSFDAAIATIDAAEPPAKLLPLLWSKGRVLRALNRTAEALALQMELRDRMQNLGIVNGHVYLEIAECKHLLKDYDEAKTYFEYAHTALSVDGWYADNHSDELGRMKYLYTKRT